VFWQPSRSLPIRLLSRVGMIEVKGGRAQGASIEWMQGMAQKARNGAPMAGQFLKDP